MLEGKKTLADFAGIITCMSFGNRTTRVQPFRRCNDLNGGHIIDKKITEIRRNSVDVRRIKLLIPEMQFVLIYDKNRRKYSKKHVCKLRDWPCSTQFKFKFVTEQSRRSLSQ